MIFMVCWQTSKAVIGAFTVRSPAPGILRNVAGLWCGVSLGLAASLLCNVCFTGVMLQIYVSDSTKVFCLFAGWPHLPAFLMTLWSEALILWRVLYGICFFEPSVSWLYRYPLLCDFMKLLFLNSELQFFLTFITHHVSVEYPLTSTGPVLSLKYVYDFYCVLQHHSRLSVLIQNFRCECCFNVTNGCL